MNIITGMIVDISFDIVKPNILVIKLYSLVDYYHLSLIGFRFLFISISFLFVLFFLYITIL